MRSEVKDRSRPAVFDETTNRLEVTDIELNQFAVPGNLLQSDCRAR